MGRKKRAEEDGKYRNYKLLLYPDNEEHTTVLERIKAEYPCHIGIKHLGTVDDETGEIIGKEHYHVYLSFPNPRAWYRLCKLLGLPDQQFCRPIENIDGALLYLCHTNTPEKEQYPLSDLFGDKTLIQKTDLLIKRYRERSVFTPEAVQTCVEYIRAYRGILSFSDFTLWAVCNNLYKGAQSPLVRECLREHNAIQARLQMQDDDSPVFREHLISISGQDYDLDDFEELCCL